MGASIDYDVLFLIAAWLEAVCYGFLTCIFCVNLYLTFGGGRRHVDSNTNVMIIVSTAMFVIATIHGVVGCYRLVVAYAFNRLNPLGGPVGYLGNLARWDQVFYEALYSTQEILGSAVATYRCWVLWNKNFKVIALPSILLLATIIFGYGAIAMFVKDGALEANLDQLEELMTWIRTFYAVAVVQNVLTTGLMIYAIYRNYRNQVGSNMRTFGGLRMAWLMRTLIEAAALQLVVEFILLITFSANTNVQYIFLYSITPIIGITFNAMSISYRLRVLTEGPHDSMHSSFNFKPATQSDTLGSSSRGQRTFQVDDIEMTSNVIHRSAKRESSSFSITE